MQFSSFKVLDFRKWSHASGLVRVACCNTVCDRRLRPVLTTDTLLLYKRIMGRPVNLCYILDTYELHMKYLTQRITVYQISGVLPFQWQWVHHCVCQACRPAFHDVFLQVCIQVVQAQLRYVASACSFEDAFTAVQVALSLPAYTHASSAS